MTRGTTLVELLLVLTLIAILAGLAMPGIAALRDQWAVQEAARAIVDAHARARLLAITERRVILLTLEADSLALRVLVTPSDTADRWHRDGPAGSGVAVTGMPHRVTFAPTGIPYGFANNSYTLTRGAAQRQVVVSRYGRVQVR